MCEWLTDLFLSGIGCASLGPNPRQKFWPSVLGYFDAANGSDDASEAVANVVVRFS